jgi:hypothetical protein
VCTVLVFGTHILNTVSVFEKILYIAVLVKKKRKQSMETKDGTPQNFQLNLDMHTHAPQI